jgi:tetratricopeptide (TPR) repeat protein
MPAGIFRPLAIVTATACLSLPVVPLAAQPATTTTAISEAAHQQFVFAYRLLQRGDNKLAIEAFDEYLGRFPRDEKRGDALYFRALLAKQAGELTQAHKLLSETAPPPTLVPVSAMLLLKGEVAADLKQFEVALQSLEKIDPATLEPALRASAFFLRGQAYRGTNNIPAAIAQYKQAAEIESPLRSRAMLELARVQASQGQIAQALATARGAAIANDPEVSPEAARTAGDFAYQAGQFAAAIDYYQIVLTQYTTSPHVSASALGSMWAMLGMKQYPQIITAFDQYKTAMTPDDRVVAWYLTGSAYQEAGEHDKAAGMFNALVMGSSGSAVEDKAMYKLAYSQVELGQYEQAQQTIARLREKHPQSPLTVDGEFLLASMDAKRADTESGIRRVTALIKQGSNKPHYAQALLLRAKLHEAANQIDKATADYTEFLAATSKASGTTTVTLSSIHEAGLRLVDLEYRQNHFENAAKVASQMLAMKDLPASQREQMLYRLALAQIKLNTLAQADQTLSTLLEQSPKGPLSAETHYYRGLTRMALQKPDLAIADLQAAAAREELSQPLKINALRLISIRQREVRNTPEIVKTIQQLEKLAGISGLSAGELLWIARYELDRQNPQAAMRYLKPIVSRQVDAATDQRAWALRMTGRSLNQLGDLPAAIAAYREAIALPHADPGRTRLELAGALRKAGSHAEAMDEYQGLINSEQSAIAAQALTQMADMHINQAKASQQSGDTAGSRQQYEDARKLLKRLVLLYGFTELSPLPEQGYLQLAHVEMQLDSVKDAVDELNELAQRFPQSPYASFAKAQGYIYQKHQLGDALFLLRKLQEQQLDPALKAMVEDRIKTLEATP